MVTATIPAAGPINDAVGRVAASEAALLVEAPGDHRDDRVERDAVALRGRSLVHRERHPPVRVGRQQRLPLRHVAEGARPRGRHLAAVRAFAEAQQDGLTGAQTRQRRQQVVGEG